MKNYLTSFGRVAVIAAGLLGGSAVVVHAQSFPIAPVPISPTAEDGTNLFGPRDPAIRAARLRDAQAQPTPRMADGRPDLSGNWSEPPRQIAVRTSADGKTLTVLDADAPDLDIGAQQLFKSRAADRERRPPYKAEYISRQREYMHTASRIDPGIHCYPIGVPRLGPPTEIVQTPTTLYFMYANQHTHRIIPIGGKHNPNLDPFPVGDSIAWWEGDTLVVDVINIDPGTWMSGDGDFHSADLHVVERFTRNGNTLDYEVIIEDPQLFTQPWKPRRGFALVDATGSQTLILNPDAHDQPDYPCVERDLDNKVNNDRF